MLANGHIFGMLHGIHIMLNEALINLLLEDKISMEEAFIKSINKKAFVELCRRKQIDLSGIEKYMDSPTGRGNVVLFK